MTVGNKILFCLLCGVSGWGHGSQSPDSVSSQALRDYQSGRYTQSERGFRELVKRDPSDAYAQFYLGQSLFRQEKYADAVGPFEKASELDRKGNGFSPDQLVMSYGISGQLKKTHTVLDQAIRQDPDYPLNYYNLACAFAEEGDKAQMLKNLDLAFERKANMLKGEQIPDPRTDSSFQKYIRDADLRLVRQLMVEASLVTLIGSGLGWTLAIFAVPEAIHWAPSSIPRLAEVGSDGTVNGFAVLMALAAGTILTAASLGVVLQTQGGDALRSSRGSLGIDGVSACGERW